MAYFPVNKYFPSAYFSAGGNSEGLIQSEVLEFTVTSTASIRFTLNRHEVLDIVEDRIGSIPSVGPPSVISDEFGIAQIATPFSRLSGKNPKVLYGTAYHNLLELISVSGSGTIINPVKELKFKLNLIVKFNSEAEHQAYVAQQFEHAYKLFSRSSGNFILTQGLGEMSPRLSMYGSGQLVRNTSLNNKKLIKLLQDSGII